MAKFTKEYLEAKERALLAMGIENELWEIRRLLIWDITRVLHLTLEHMVDMESANGQIC